MELTKEAVREYLHNLPAQERETLLSEFSKDTDTRGTSPTNFSRREILDNKQAVCPHCGHAKYVKYGIDKGAQRYKCKSCKRNFTEYTGTWMAGIHKKDKLNAYMGLMLEEKSLDKIKEELRINKKTAFDWRHKILSSLEDIDKDTFSGITESDETFLLFSEKGKRTLSRKGKKRGGSSKSRGISNDQVAVIATTDRAGQQSLNVATLGRLKKEDIERSIGERITDKTILCSDSHVSYKGFAKDKSIEHHAVRADLKQYVKDGIYHVQHVNSIHNRLKKWINDEFWGVSTKYLQQYLNWFRTKEMLRYKKQPVSHLAQQTIVDIKAIVRYGQIKDNYEILISSQL